MSFSLEIKNELARVPINKKCCACAELYGLLLYGGEFGCTRIRLAFRNPAVKKRAEQLFYRVVGIKAEFCGKNGGFSLNIEQPEIIKKVYEVFGYDYINAPLHINFGILEEECCRAAFLRGAFLSGGSVTNPEKKYHWELASHHAGISREMLSLMPELGFFPKMLKRKNDYIIYFKDSTVIEDLLTCMGAGLSAVSIMQIKVEKEIRNGINRCMNCDDANITKTITAAAKQIRAIEKLKSDGRFYDLPENLRITAELRAANPELTLRELLELFDPPISKPGLSHRLNKLVQLAGIEDE